MDRPNSDIASFLSRNADLMELGDANPFKVRSYRTAAETVEDVGRPLEELVAESGPAALLTLPGVGKSIAGQIEEYLGSGTSASFERLRTEVPESVLEITTVRGIGPRMAAILYRSFGILDLEDLARFAEGGGFEAVPGLGDRAIARLGPAVAKAVGEMPRIPLEGAQRLASAAVETILAIRPSAEIVVVGEIRRRMPAIASIDVLAVVESDSAGVVDAFLTTPVADRRRVRTAERAEVATSLEVPMRLWTTSPVERAVALVRTTGSRRHVRQLEERAEEVGLAFRKDGLFDEAGNALEVASEEALYERLQLALVPPEGRTGAE